MSIFKKLKTNLEFKLLKFPITVQQDVDFMRINFFFFFKESSSIQFYISNNQYHPIYDFSKSSYHNLYILIF